jgi:hypothetical protein
MTSENSRPRFFIVAFAVACIVALAAAGGLVYYFFQYNAVSAIVAEKDAQLTAVNNQIATLNNRVTGLTADLVTLNATIAPVKSQLALTLDQLKTANAYIDTVQQKIASATAEAAALKTDNERLQSIVRLNESSIKTTALTIHQKAATVSEVVSFNAEYAGYIVVSGTSSAPTGYILVTDDNPNFPFSTYKYYFSSGSVFSVPVLPGTIGVFFGNSEKENEYNATLTVTYYY